MKGEPASIEPALYDPAETAGAFTERFVTNTAGRPAELVALAVWRMCGRAYCLGWSDARASRPLAVAAELAPGSGSGAG